MRKTIQITATVRYDDDDLEAMSDAANVEKSTALAHILEGAEFPVDIDSVRFMFSIDGVEDE